MTIATAKITRKTPLEVLETLLGSLVDDPREIIIDDRSNDDVAVFLVSVPKDQLRYLIGAEGRTMNLIEGLMHRVVRAEKRRLSMTVYCPDDPDFKIPKLPGSKKK